MEAEHDRIGLHHPGRAIEPALFVRPAISPQTRKAMRVQPETVDHPFGTIKARMGATHFLMKTLPRVAGEMALHVLASNLTRTDYHGVKPLLAAMRQAPPGRHS